MLTSTMVLVNDFKYYKRIYNTLPNRKFYRNGDQVYSYSYGEKDDGFVWFTDDNHFKLSDGHYIHNAEFTFLSPYSWYWLVKYRKWFKENVDFNTLPSYLAL